MTGLPIESLWAFFNPTVSVLDVQRLCVSIKGLKNFLTHWVRRECMANCDQAGKNWRGHALRYILPPTEPCIKNVYMDVL